MADHRRPGDNDPTTATFLQDRRQVDPRRVPGELDPTTANLPQGPFQPLAPGTLMRGRYRVVSQIGKGGMGYVYLVQDENFDARPRRSMKEMIPRLDDHQQQAHMVNFKREADVLETLRHPNIPRVYDSFTEFRRAYLVLDYIEGRDLEQVLDSMKQGFLSPQIVGGWMIQLCSIVEYLHSHNPPIIFRDLKPSNVILTPDGRIILIDFGIAKVFAPDEKQTNVGTQGYAAREQYKGEAEVRSDVYALGGMMHHLLTKSDPRFQPPFSFHERPPSVLNSAVTPELERVIMRCLEDERDKRYQTVADLRIALEDALHLSDTGYFRAIDKVGGPARGPIRTGSTTMTMGRNLRERWRFRTEEEVRSTPTVANGVVYIGSYDYNVYGLNIQNGSMVWKFATEGGVCGQPAVWRNLVIFGSEDFYVYAVYAYGAENSATEAWRYRTHHHVRSSPRIFDDRLYIGSDDAVMHAIDPRTGRAIWPYRAYREIQSSPARAHDLIYFGSNDEYFYAVNELTGEKKWSFRSQGGVVSSPAVAGEYVYFGSMDFGVYALDAKSGWQAWRELTDKFVISSPRIVGDRLFIGSSDKHLHCLDRRTGKHIWKYPAGHQITATPAFSNGVIYFGCVDGALYALDANSGKLLGHFQTGDKICGSPTVEDGVVYTGSSDGCIYALDAIS